jgi:hypothetical protein
VIKKLSEQRKLRELTKKVTNAIDSAVERIGSALYRIIPGDNWDAGANRRTALFLALTAEMDAMTCAGCRAKQLEGLIGLLQKRLDEAGHKGERHVH